MCLGERYLKKILFLQTPDDKKKRRVLVTGPIGMEPKALDSPKVAFD
jgi:hypothetical protein